MMIPKFQHAFVLHARAFRETSLIVELFTKDLGRVSVIAQGAKRPKSSYRGLLQPFVPLTLTLSGSRELQALRQAEACGHFVSLQGPALMSGLYLNELLIKLMPKQDPHPDLFERYYESLVEMATNSELEKPLRKFEWALLQDLGYGLQLEYCEEEKLIPDQYYYYQYGKGLIRATQTMPQAYPFLGANLIALARQEWDDSSQLLDAKRLLRYVITALLGGKSITSRELFM